RSRGDTEAVDKPEDTRWDELQRASFPVISELKKWSKEFSQQLEASLLRDLGHRPQESFGQNLALSLSVSQIENYLKCPFKFAAARLFCLSDLPSLDLDIDHLTRGQLMHALFESLTEEPMRFD